MRWRTTGSDVSMPAWTISSASHSHACNWKRHWHDAVAIDIDVEDQPEIDENDETVIDCSALEQIMAIDPDNGQSLLNGIIDTFCDDGAELVDSLLVAANADDMDGVASVAHSLKSSSASVGAMRLSNLSRNLEASARSNDRNAVRGAAATARQEFEAAANAISASATTA